MQSTELHKHEDEREIQKDTRIQKDDSGGQIDSDRQQRKLNRELNEEQIQVHIREIRTEVDEEHIQANRCRQTDSSKWWIQTDKSR
ncbi:hypothetical protein Tco_1506696 [Tanacetum coccineum]